MSSLVLAGAPPPPVSWVAQERERFLLLRERKYMQSSTFGWVRHQY